MDFNLARVIANWSQAMNDLPTSSFEGRMRQAVRMPDPRSEFAEGLWQHMTMRPRRKPAQFGNARSLFSRPAWVGTIVFFVLAMITILAIGPQRVLAAIQSLFVYIPGVGFVQADTVMALKKPVSMTKGDLTLQVEQLVASNSETVMVMVGSGFPPYQNIELNRRVTLRLPDGEEWAPGDRSLDITQNPGEYRATIKFKPLPPGTNKVTVVWRQSITTSGKVIQSWEIPVELYPSSDPQVSARLPFSYSPQGVFATDHDVTLRIDQVSQSLTDTAVRVRYELPEEYGFGNLLSETLWDELGNRYEEKSNQVHFEDNGQAATYLPTSVANPKTYTSFYWTLDFPALDPNARQLTLKVDRFWMRSQPNTTLKINLGQEPRVGDTWQIDQTIPFADTAVTIVQARLVSENLISVPPPGSNGTTANPTQEDLVGLVLNLQPVDPSKLQISQVWLDVPGSRKNVYDPGTGTWAPAWDREALLAGEIEVHIGLMEGSIKGPWVITWNRETR
jgi:hypothetical protein